MPKGRQLGRNRSFDGTIIRKESEDLVAESKQLSELGAKFERDKEILEKEILKVQLSKVTGEDEKAMIECLEIAIEIKKQEYDRDVSKEQERIQRELIDETDTMQEVADELDQQSTDFRSVQMEASGTDASAAADAASEKKQAFEEMKAEYLEKQKLLMEQAAAQQRRMRQRNLTGR